MRVVHFLSDGLDGAVFEIRNLQPDQLVFHRQRRGTHHAEQDRFPGRLAGNDRGGEQKAIPGNSIGLGFPDVVGEDGGALVINLEDPADELVLLNELAQWIRLHVFVHSMAI